LKKKKRNRFFFFCKPALPKRTPSLCGLSSGSCFWIFFSQKKEKKPQNQTSQPSTPSETDCAKPRLSASFLIVLHSPDSFCLRRPRARCASLPQRLHFFCETFFGARASCTIGTNSRFSGNPLFFCCSHAKSMQTSKKEAPFSLPDNGICLHSKLCCCDTSKNPLPNLFLFGFPSRPCFFVKKKAWLPQKRTSQAGTRFRVPTTRFLREKRARFVPDSLRFREDPNLVFRVFSGLSDRPAPTATNPLFLFFVGLRLAPGSRKNRFLFFEAKLCFKQQKTDKKAQKSLVCTSRKRSVRRSGRTCRRGVFAFQNWLQVAACPHAVFPLRTVRLPWCARLFRFFFFVG